MGKRESRVKFDQSRWIEFVGTEEIWLKRTRDNGSAM
jgi:hypothetical protein